jgi:nicotinate phosphoribosyltransferase
MDAPGSGDSSDGDDAAADANGRRYDLLTADDIDAGRATAAYFLRTEAVLDHVGADPNVVAEVSAPEGWHVLAGLEDATRLLSGLPVDVSAPPEGTVVSGGPVLRLDGPYRAFARYESALLGFLAHASGVATAAMEVRAAAEGRTVLSFGTRRQHPALGAMVERAALVGGADGIGNVAGGDVVGVEAGGTMPHALVVCLGDAATAFAAYDETVPSDVPRTMVCDTFGDEVAEVVTAAETLGDSLDAVRLDTSPSRRGDMRAIAEEVRYELDRRGLEAVEVMVSGGIDAAAVRRLRGVVDAFGVGGAIADADPVDLSMNVVEVDGEARAKRGVRRGAKQVYRDGFDDRVVPVGEAAPGEPLLRPVVEDGEVVVDFPLSAARERVREAIEPLRDRGAFEDGE